VFDLSGRVVLVTGASRGIGRAVALELGFAGSDVVVHHRANPARAETVRAELAKLGVDARVVAGDVTNPEETARMVGSAGDWKGRLDGVVTAAGIYRGDASDAVGTNDFSVVLRTDLEGTFRTVQAALPFLRKSVRPAVVTVSSVLGAHAAVGGVAYQAAKAGVEQMTRALALELAPRIRVNSIAPGFIRTDMNRDGHEDPRFYASVVKATPLGRWGEPDDVAPAVRYLLSLEADWVTGLVLGVDGGVALR
jgi:NAD(P)-dependent dehydrogenase (short-subunit alcohol dehydrogenase family)